MGYFANLEIEVMDLAQEGFDPFTISRKTELTVLQVQEILDCDADYDPRDYADDAAELDAIHYGSHA